MKTRFNSYDIVCVVSELQKYVGMRVNNIYDIDNKTYLIRLQRNEEKVVLLLESGNRLHTTAYEWPKNNAPSGFSMKMRKHLKNKRLEVLNQLGSDRIVDLQFGTGEAAYHLILELYDRGNIILTDYLLTILYVLRPHVEGDKVKFAVREAYPRDRARESSLISKNELIEILESAKTGDTLKKVLISKLEYGPPLLEHVLIQNGFQNKNKVGKTFDIQEDSDKLYEAIKEADKIFLEAKQGNTKGYIIQKQEERLVSADSSETQSFFSNQEFHPSLFTQHSSSPFKEFETFNAAVDEFFSTAEAQKLELRAIQQERDALKKLDNVKKDHSQRLVALEKTQEVDKQKAELITRNQWLVEKAIIVIQSALASQLSWTDIEELVKDAALKGDQISQIITNLKLDTNHISLRLTDPYADSNSESKHSSDFIEGSIPTMVVDVDLGLSAYANARKYYDQKRNAAKKQQKTIESQSKAFKSAEKKTKQTLKEVQTITSIIKARKIYWFEKFFWFISSENYLVIAGRDQQQNELIVKRYMRPSDVYVHADVHGASSVIIKNPGGAEQPVPPKTLNEAGTMAICYSVAWEAKVITNAYWVWGEQVSKTAPTGEYLGTGSFMIRGKKNFLPPSHLILGLSFLFRLEDGCIESHKGERLASALEDDTSSMNSGNQERDEQEDVEINLASDGEENEKPDIEAENHEENEEQIDSNCQKDEESSDEESETDKNQFPDTQVKIQHFAGTKTNILTETIALNDKSESETDVVYLGDSNPVLIRQTSNRSRGNSESKNKKIPKPLEKKDNKDDSTKPAKRGQKSKLKKIKEKYKDQDDEERQLRMDILQSSGTAKETKKNKKSKETKNTHKPVQPRPKREPQVNPEDDGGGDDEEPVFQADVDVIDALTGIPNAEDELLYAVPVVAPYNTLAQYKFKVKLTPGTGRRGKAAKTAVAMFLKDRTITQREKDLLKAVKDEQLARNIPGKVKLSAPGLKALKK